MVYNYNKGNDEGPLNNLNNNFSFFVEDIEEKFPESKNNILLNFVKQEKRILHIFCMNAAFGFNKILKEGPHSIIITSGTLAPLNGMESELNIKFNIKLEGNHIIEKNQIHLGVISNTKYNINENFLFTLKNRDNNEMIINLGKIIIDICQVSPGGVLCFFPSYALKEIVLKLWEEKNIIKKIKEYKYFYDDTKKIKSKKHIFDSFKNSNTNY